MTLLCITASMEHTRTCTIRDHHLTTCASDDCKGCLPRPAETGILCRGCWERFEAALSVAVDLITHMRSIEKGPASIVPTRSAPGSRVILPGSWMEADNLWDSLVELALAYAESKGIEDPVWKPMYDGFSTTASLDDVALQVRELVMWLQVNPVDVVSRAGGAEAAVKFYRQAQRALAMFPIEDRAQRLKPIRCRECQQFTLWKHPPLVYLDDVVVQCANKTCEALYDPQLAGFDMLVLAQQISAEREDLAADIAGQVSRLLAKPSAELLSIKGHSEACADGYHWGWSDEVLACRNVACRCVCHERAVVDVGRGASTPVVNTGHVMPLPPGLTLQDPATCPRCWTIHHPEGACA